jgi:cell cycle checkpoint protein
MYTHGNLDKPWVLYQLLNSIFLAVLDFISDEAMDDAWHVSSYFSDSDLLLSSFRGMLARYNEAENVLQSAAASVAVRGVLFGNSHPSPPRFLLEA